VKDLPKFLAAAFMLGLVPLLQQEVYAWCPWLAEKLIRRAVRWLPPHARERYLAEWLADLDMWRGRNLSALLWAIDTLLKAPKLRGALRVGSPVERHLGKRVLDVTVAGLMLAVIAPLLGAITIAIKLTSPGPVLVRHQRAGLQGKQFGLLQFRTDDPEFMLDEALLPAGVDDPLFELHEDPRVTKVGRFLRRSSLHELPQLVNVLKGDMSLVGPQPPHIHDVARFKGRYRETLRVRPGITGISQTGGRIPEFDDYTRIRLDRFYIENWSISFDVYLILRRLAPLSLLEGTHSSKRSRRRKRRGG
jgi:lipopolysaccharide/colanic/teichoic acid biosynthesis glycosyltransferase